MAAEPDTGHRAAFFERQGQHLLLLALLLYGSLFLVTPSGLTGKAMGLSGKVWFWICETVPVVC